MTQPDFTENVVFENMQFTCNFSIVRLSNTTNVVMATPDITPAQLLPCLSREIVLKIVEITDVSQM